MGSSVGNLQDREKALSVAYLRILGGTQKEAAEAAGCSERSVRGWEAADWWPEIQVEAESRWLPGLIAKARGTLLNDMDGPLALKVLERLLPELAPAKHHVEHGGSIETGVAKLSDEELVTTVNRLTALARASANGSEDGVPLTVEGGGSGESPC